MSFRKMDSTKDENKLPLQYDPHEGPSTDVIQNHVHSDDKTISAIGNLPNYEDRTIDLASADAVVRPTGDKDHTLKRSKEVDAIGIASSSRDNFPDTDEPLLTGAIKAFVEEPVREPVQATGVTVVGDENEKQTDLLLFLLPCTAIVLVAIVAIVVPLTGRSWNSPSSAMELPTISTATPTLAPTADDFPKLAELFEHLSGRDVFKDRNSPQFKALSWLTQDDTLFSGKETEVLDTAKYRQRYILAVFFFACLGDLWRRCSQNLVCPSGVNPWLSATDECSWLFVACNNDGFVSSMNFDVSKLNWGGGSSFSPPDTLPYVMGSLPNEFSGLSHLELFFAEGHKLQGSISPIWEIASLRSVSLKGNSMTGIIPLSVETDVPLLGTLNLEANSIGGSFPDSISGLKYLKELVLDSNKLTGTIPSKLGLISGLSLLDLQDNNLHGEIPLNLYHNPKIEVFKVGGNRLQGSIPSEISEMSQLKELSLDDSQMSGDIPSEVYRLENLKILELQNANFSGKLSEDFALLNGTIKGIILKGNDFFGDIPTGFDVLTHLEVLDLSDNPRITGVISKVICSRMSSAEMRQVDRISILKEGPEPRKTTMSIDATQRDVFRIRQNYNTSFIQKGTLTSDCLAPGT